MQTLITTIIIVWTFQISNWLYVSLFPMIFEWTTAISYGGRKWIKLTFFVHFLVFYRLIKGMCPKICGNWVLLIYLKIPTSLLEDYNLDESNLVNVTKYIWIIASPILILIGTVTNAISVVVLSRKRLMISNSIFYLTILSGDNILCCISGCCIIGFNTPFKLTFEHFPKLRVDWTPFSYIMFPTF